MEVEGKWMEVEGKTPKVEGKLVKLEGKGEFRGKVGLVEGRILLKMEIFIKKRGQARTFYWVK